MTKEEFIATVQNQLAAGSETAALLKKMHEMDVIRMVEIAYETLIYQSLEQYLTGRKKDPSVFDSYTVSYPDFENGTDAVPVLFDSTTKEHYSIIPLPLMQLPQNISIRHVGPVENPDIGFWYRSASANRVISQLDVEKIMTETEYNIIGSKIVYKNINKLMERVLLRFLPSFSEIDEDQQIYFPMGTAALVFQMVTDMMMGRMTTPEPVYNNNNSKQR